MLLRCLARVKQPASQLIRINTLPNISSLPAVANLVSLSQPSASAPLREHSNWARGDSTSCGWQSAAQWPHPSPPSYSSPTEQSVSSRAQRRGMFSFPSNNSNLNKQYDERRLVGYSPEQLFDVVADVEDYHNFVPWCARSVIVERHSATRFDAELEVGFRVFVERYTSEVHLQPPMRVISNVNDSTLFDHLDTTWEFQTGPTPRSCWLTFSTDFAFKSPLYGQLASVFFQEVTRQMMSAFEGRCRARFGASAFEQQDQQR